ncbi:MAG: bifunctional transaldolase/phosoglucose isomerase [Gemmatimonadales bacterium]
MRALAELGQSVWLDYLRRGMVRSGELESLVHDGLRGMTSNPTIFEHAIGGSADYDDALKELASSRKTDREVFDVLAIQDVREAADLFRPVYDRTDGADGFISLEVSPGVARDTEGSIAEARRLWNAVDRPNVMIKIPAMREGWPAIERCLREGININITLLFSVEHYRAVLEAYLRALEARVRDGQTVDRIASVASFFVSRVDTEVDRRIEARGGSLMALRGRVAIANARLAYAAFLEVSRSARWLALASKGARVQRPLWASTGTKNPAYSDVLYLESLIGPDTVTTVPPDTLRLFEEHGTVRRTLADDPGDAREVMDALADGGIDFADVNRVLEEEGIEKFAVSFDKLLGVIGGKRKMFAGRTSAETLPPRPSTDLGRLGARVERRLDAFSRSAVARRIWSRDVTVWKDDPATPELRDRLGWLTVGEKMAQQAASLAAFGDEIRVSFDRVVLCGMGGSSLAPEVLWRTFGRRPGYPELSTLDSTDPRAIAAADAGGKLGRTLFIVSSKSGTTQETLSFYRHYWELTGGRGSQFVAITDPGTPLATLAAERGFRRCFLNPPNIGGRYSALSYFGLVPAALIGIDVGELLHRSHRMAEACAACVPDRENPGAWLGAVMGEAALAGRDKLTFILAPGVSGLGLWAEQLLAESTGKEGTGIIPVVGEPPGAPEVYGSDRIFVAITLADEADPDALVRLDALRAAGHPVVRLTLRDRYDVGSEFFRWEFATAVAGSVLGINPFDQPNVAESKRNTERVLGGRPAPSRSAGRDDLDAFLSGIEPGHYLALLAYLPPTPEHRRRLDAIRVGLRDRLRVATAIGYGPRYLHSTGQLHKGGPPTGHFLQIPDPAPDDIQVPGEPFTFGELLAAQAEGDFLALEGRGRPVVRVAGLESLEG